MLTLIKALLASDVTSAALGLWERLSSSAFASVRGGGALWDLLSLQLAAAILPTLVPFLVRA